MGWASAHITKLQAGETVSFRPRGNSMTPRIKSGQLCTVKPVTDYTVIAKGDVVLCKVHSSEYLHLVCSVRTDHEKRFFQIGNNHGHINGWIPETQVYGILSGVES